jgi:hypothetical protein
MYFPFSSKANGHLKNSNIRRTAFHIAAAFNTTATYKYQWFVKRFALGNPPGLGAFTTNQQTRAALKHPAKNTKYR